MKNEYSHLLSGKRILFVLCGFDLGGAERQALYLATYLKRIGADVRVWGHHHRYPGPERVITICEEFGIPWAEYKFRWPCGKKDFLIGFWRLLRGLYRERPDIIMPYLHWPSVGCGLVWRLSPAKICIWGQRDVDGLRGDGFERYAYRQASAVICNAEHEVTYLKEIFGKSKVPMHIVHNGVALASPVKNRAQWRHELGLENNVVVVTMLANFREQKDHITLLKAWSLVISSVFSEGKQLRLLLPGAPQTSYERVKAFVGKCGVEDTVVFPGQVSDISGILAASEIGVLTTFNEGFPNAVLEYMACGLPVVATDIPGVREVLGNNAEEQLCRMGDPEDFAQKLEALICSPEQRQHFGTKNKDRVMREFSIDVMCEKMCSVIIQSLNNQMKKMC